MKVPTCSAWLAVGIFYAAACDNELDSAAPWTAADGGSDTDAVSYKRDVQPIFQRCVVCHAPGNITGYDLVNPFDQDHGIVGRANDWQTEGHDSLPLVVEPGNPDDSFLIYKVATDPAKLDEANNGSPMPIQLDPLTDDQLANIEQWISDGAKNDAFFTNTVAPIFGTAVTLGRAAGQCTFCHYPDSSTGLDILAPFDAKKGLVGAPSLLSKKLRVQPGSPDDSFLIEKLRGPAAASGGSRMPLDYERLSSQEVDTLRAWIDQGALNN